MNRLEQIVAQIPNDLPQQDNKVHVLYISPFLSGVGLYRAIIPYIELNKTDTHSAIITELCPFTNQPFQITINDPQIEWADYIVFQTSFHNLKEHIDLFRSINPKAIFCMDIDDCYHEDMFRQDINIVRPMREQLIKNMNVCDFIVAENETLANYYTGLTITPIKIMPNFMNRECLEFDKKERTTDKTRIGMIFNATQFKDIQIVRKPLLEIQKNKDVEIIVFGFNGILPKPYINALQGVNYTHIHHVPVTKYFETLHNLHFDIALQPLVDSKHNHCKSFHKTLQYSMFGIPIVCSDVEPYARTKFLGLWKCKEDEDWIEGINNIDMCGWETNKNIVDNNYFWDTNINILTEIYAR